MKFIIKLLFLIFPLYSCLQLNAQTFTPKDTIIGSNFFQVEFSDDMRSMVWCEQISINKAQVWYADMDLNSGLPDLINKKRIDTIQGQGWPYWGQDNISRFFIIKNQHNEIKYIRRTEFNTLILTNLGIVNNDVKSLLNVSSDSTKAYFWINYIVLNPDDLGRDSLFAFRSDKPSERILINSEIKNKGGSAYELTFPRWMAQSEILAYPFRPFEDKPYWDMKFWNGATKKSTQVTNDIPNSIFNHHVDDLPFRLPQFPNDTFMSSSKGASKLAIYKKSGEYFSQVQLHTSPTAIIPTTLTSFEPFTINGDKTYRAYQVYSGSGILGKTAGEIYLIGIFNDDLIIKISGYHGDVAVDPEYVIGKNKVWIYYYGKPLGQGFFNLHRCETPLVIGSTSIDEQNSIVENISVYPNPANNTLFIQGHTNNISNYDIVNMFGQTLQSGVISNGRIDISQLPVGLYFIQIGNYSEKLIVVR